MVSLCGLSWISGERSRACVCVCVCLKDYGKHKKILDGKWAVEFEGVKEYKGKLDPPGSLPSLIFYRPASIC